MMVPPGVHSRQGFGRFADHQAAREAVPPVPPKEHGGICAEGRGAAQIHNCSRSNARPAKRGGQSASAANRPSLTRITVHGTRKTCASLLAALDVHPRVAMRILRHSKIAFTMEIYTGAPSDATRNALRKLGDLLT